METAMTTMKVLENGAERFVTAGGVTITRERHDRPYEGAIDAYVDGLNSRRGAVFSSNYEYPGRYTRWDTAIIDPPLVISARGRAMRIEALNGRGEALLPVIGRTLGGLADVTITETSKRLIRLDVAKPGRVFTEEEVTRLAQFCIAHDLILVSDEIHCDLVLDPAKTKHFSALELPEELRQKTITLLSPSKTWNIAGLGYAFSVIPDESIRRKFVAERGHTLSEINALSYYAAESAYRDGEPWRQQLLAYLRDNRAFLDSFLAEKAPQLTVVPGQATYLAWIDARGLGVSNPAQFFEKEAGLFLSDGAAFGWPGWIRFNFGCTRARLQEGLEKLVAALPKA